MTNDFIKDCKEIIEDKLKEYEGLEADVCELPYFLLETDFQNGTMFHNTQKSKDYVYDNDWYARQFFEESPERVNPLDYDIFVLSMFEWGVGNILSQCKYLHNKTNVTIDEELIENVLKEIDNVKDIE